MPDEENVDPMTSSATSDVVVLGSGLAGLAGALAAHQLGLRPIVLEKAKTLGGGTVNSYGLIWVGQNHLAEAAGYGDTRDETIAYVRFLGGGSLDDDRMSTFVDRSPEALKFFENCGVRFRLVRGVTDHYYGTSPGAHAVGRTVEAELISGFDLGDWRALVPAPDDVPSFVTAEEQVAWGGINSFSDWDQDLVRERRRQDMRGKGSGLISHFLKELRARGVPVLSDRHVECLAVENRRVTGVVMRSGETIGARKGVLLATGTYSANPEMMRQFEQLPGIADEASSLAPPSLTGDGLVLGAEIGGIVHRIENSLRLMLSYTIPPERPGGTPTCVYVGIVELSFQPVGGNKYIRVRVVGHADEPPCVRRRLPSADGSWDVPRPFRIDNTSATGSCDRRVHGHASGSRSHPHGWVRAWLYSCCRCNVNRPYAQKMPSDAFASSDISSGDHGGRKTSSGLTSPIPSIGARNARI